MDRYHYWLDRGDPPSYYDGPLDLVAMLRAWFARRTWPARFWLKHRLLRRPLPPIPEHRTLDFNQWTDCLKEVYKLPRSEECP